MPQVDLIAYANIQQDMSEGEVLARLGPPDYKSGSAHVCRWYWLSEAGDLQQITVLVEFWNGRVHSKERTIS